jgi:acetyl-CoA acetyltransferase
MARIAKRPMDIAVVGMGTTGVIKASPESPATLASTALSRALADAGLAREAIDGLVVHIGSPRGMDYDRTASQLGLRVRFAAQPWSHGRFAATVINQAAMALSWGLCDYAVCLVAYRNSTFARHGDKARPTYHESLREGGGPHGETPHAGFNAPVVGAAMAAQRYFHTFGIDREKLAAVPLAFRRHARLNPTAAMQKPLDLATYSGARAIAEPLRLHDCSVVVDGAAALILTTADRAADTARTPLWIMGLQGIHAGPDEFIFGQRGLGIDQADIFEERRDPRDEACYQMAGILPGDVDTLHCYDAFSPQALWTLERFGFCGLGEAADWVQGGRIEIGGELPMNTSGGHLSEGQLNGWGQIVEMVTQLRGDAGQRQVVDARIAQWATTLGDSVILGVDR